MGESFLSPGAMVELTPPFIVLRARFLAVHYRSVSCTFFALPDLLLKARLIYLFFIYYNLWIQKQKPKDETQKSQKESRTAEQRGAGGGL